MEKPWTKRMNIESIFNAYICDVLHMHKITYGSRVNDEDVSVPEFLEVAGSHALEDHFLWMAPFSFKFRRVELLYDAKEGQYYTKYSIHKTLEYV